MTSIEYDKLSHEEQRILVAELDGWTSFNNCQWTGKLQGQAPWYHEVAYNCRVPNYLNDLNEIQKLIRKMTESQYCEYVQVLCGHTTEGERIKWGVDDVFTADCATAAQKAKAFVLTMNEYDDYDYG